MSGELWVVRKKEEKRNEEVAMTNDKKTVKEHLSEIQKGGTQFIIVQSKGGHPASEFQLFWYCLSLRFRLKFT